MAASNSESSILSVASDVCVVATGAFVVLALAYSSYKSAGLVARQKKLFTIHDGTVLKWKLSRNGIVEAKENNGLLAKLAAAGQQHVTLFEAVQALRWAKDDDRVKGLEMDFGQAGFSATPRPQLGLAQAQELHEAIRAFREAKRRKFGDKKYSLTAFTDTFDNQDYFYLATAFDKVTMEPNGLLQMNGYSSTMPFVKTLLERLGVDVVPLSKGECKGAMAMFTDTEMPKPIYENTKALFGALNEQFLRGIASARSAGLQAFSTSAMKQWGGMTKTAEGSEIQMTGNMTADDKVRALMDVSPLMSDEALSAGLITDVAYKRETWHKGAESKVQEMPFTRYKYLRAKEVKKELKKLPAKKKVNIALIHVSGQIKEGEGQYAPDKVAKTVLEAAEDKNVGAIVMRMNTPGGGMWASDTMRDAIEYAQEHYKKPVIASFGNVSASGGVWITANCRKILASPGTITGSIGIAYARPVLTQKFLGHFGLNVDNRVAFSDGARAGSVFNRLSGRNLARVQSMSDTFYENFIDVVAKGRRMPREQVEKIAGGRVYTGEQALELGLIDELGGLERALQVAMEHAEHGSDNAKMVVQVYPRSKGALEDFVESGALDDYLGAISVDMQASVAGIAQAATRHAVHACTEQLARSAGVSLTPSATIEAGMDPIQRTL
ncbi:hypothetical protein PhCBS80983_g02204 [Powellomyces hirtus]|uniref:Peptidase S49 domain-containing protein n=1 Tax=Powellomyces hirtus TaxID=109895 RepID=A0A507E6U2_9FUNG|nr:hypothetical protein PhCBS80983_g02204 [Powellomyces hirtus]